MRGATGWLWLPCAFVSMLLVSGCDGGPSVRVDAVVVRLVAQNRSWHASYLVPESPGRGTEVPTGREVHVPLGAAVWLTLTSQDFVSDFRVAGIGLHDFAAPDLPSQFYFHADRPGRHEVRGDELCGLPHTDKARGWLVVEDAAAFQAWMRKRIREDKG